MRPSPRLVVALAALALLSPGTGAHLAPRFEPARALDHAPLGLPAAPPLDGRAWESVAYGWAERDRLLGHAIAPRAPGPVAVASAVPLTSAVLDAYVALGLPAPGPAAIAGMRAQEAGLDPGMARATAGLVAALAAYQAAFPALLPALMAAAQVPHEAGHVDALPADDTVAAMRGHAQRVAQAIDAVREAAHAAGPFPARGGVVFHDPGDLVVVGDAGANTYRGNTLGNPFLEATANLLTLDEGGDDLYLNNAGGAYPTTPCYTYAFFLFHTTTQFKLPDPSRPDLGLCGNGLSAAASIDLGGDDTYVSDQEAGVDEHQVAQGSSMFGGLGFLVDEAGDDTYEATLVERGLAYQAVQGGSGAISFYGFALFLDGAGSDAYRAVELGSAHPENSQQRAQGGGEAVFLDLGPGDDTFFASQEGPAPAWQGAQGFLATFVDEAGDDTFTLLQATGAASQQLGHGEDGPMLLLHGDDTYVAHQECAGTCGFQDVQGSAEAGGAGQLVDVEGDDVYEAVAGSLATQGAQGGAIFAPAMLVDLAGNDTYLASAAALYQYAQAGSGGSAILLYDGGGDDRYIVFNGNPGPAAGNSYAQGGSAGLYAFLVDLSGDDVYRASFDPAGGSVQHVRGYAEREGFGLFLDGGGRDDYDVIGADDSAWVQGTGAGVDQQSG
ncbi:MAG: hypothetical protein LC624_08635 [Halobacteriales archaeon]|nr:hypothetical protein [Halobacteriales archaeon]